MTTRLENAIKQLSPEELIQLEEYAETLAAHSTAPPRFLNLTWIGTASDLKKEYASGVDAAHAATDMINEHVEKRLRR